jgi:phosphatidylglycerophosphate synthase
MFDARLRKRIDPLLNRTGRAAARFGVSANAMTLIGCALGLAAALAILFHAFGTALALFVAGRVADGLDGAISRARAPTDRGGYLDIVLDFAVYAAIPLAFAVALPEVNALPAAVLLAAIVLNGSAFLAFAIMAERRGIVTTHQGQKSLYYLAGLAEGSETILAYVVMMAWPTAFPAVAYAFAALCAMSGIARIIVSWQLLQPN